MSAARYCVALDQLAAADVWLAGRKAANLVALLRAGLPVPRGFVVTTSAFREFLVASPIAGLERATTASAAVQSALLEAAIPDDLVQAITAAAAAHGADAAFAVRSSATAEDRPDASFAGQHDSFLNIQGLPALLDAIRACWASLYTERAIAYRLRKHIDTDRVAMAVIVQEFIAADAAGVVFTADPVSGRSDRIVCEAVAGLAEGLVSGQANPDRMVLDRRTFALIESRVARKDIRIAACPSGGVGAQPIPPHERHRPCLAGEIAVRLTELAVQIERVFGSPQDIEWALQNRRFFVLQSRPITTASPARGGTPVRSGASLPPRTGTIVWSNVNTGELLPDVATPMTFSVIRSAVLDLFGPLLLCVGIDLRKERWFDLIAGRIYANVSVFNRLLHSLPGTRHLDLTASFGGQQGSGLAAALIESEHVGWWRRIRTLAGFGGLLLWCVAHSTSERSEALLNSIRRRVDGLVTGDVAARSDEQLCAFVQSLLRRAFQDNNALALAALGFSMVSALFAATRRWLDDPHGAIANRLLSGAGGMASAEAGLDLWRLATWARSDPPLAQTLSSAASFAALQQQLAPTELGSTFLQRWAAWMTVHGHHTDGEIDVHRPRWAETPDAVLGILRAYLSCPAEAGAPTSTPRWNDEQARLLAQCQQRLGRLRSAGFRLVLGRARRGVVLRENFKSEAVRLIAALRRALLELGTRFVQQNVLAERDDVFFLQLSELDRIRSGVAGFDIGAIIAARRAEYLRNRKLTPPPVIIGEFRPDDREHAPAAAAPAPARPGAELRGLAVSAGVATGQARVMLRPGGSEHVRSGEILVAPFADPGWTPHFLPAAGIVMDLGGMLSHGCIVAREYGIPAVVNVGTGTRTIHTGDVIQVDGDQGIVTILASANQTL